MKTKRLNLSLGSVCLLLVLLASSYGQEEYSPARYQLIIERSPFGKEEVAAPPAANSRQQEQIEQRVEQQLRLCLLSESEADGEMFAGFQNLRAGAGDPKSITLMVGESYQSMKLVEIDLDQSSATLEYMNNKITMNLSAPTQPARNQRPPTTINRTTRNTTTSNRRFGGRLQAQEAPEPELSAEEQAARLAEIRARLQEQQMDIIRKGQPPLPIPLTPEQDDQLVNEGVLDPVQ